jgi:hypothetical protein
LAAWLFGGQAVVLHKTIRIELIQQGVETPGIHSRPELHGAGIKVKIRGFGSVRNAPQAGSDGRIQGRLE